MQYLKIFEKKYDYPIHLLRSAINDEYHLIWYMCKDYANRVLTRDPSWKWLATRIDDFSLLATQYMCRRLPIWVWKASFELGSLNKVLNSISETIIWIMNRWVSTLKNLFDSRYSFFVSHSFIIPFDEVSIQDKSL